MSVWDLEDSSEAQLSGEIHKIHLQMIGSQELMELGLLNTPLCTNKPISSELKPLDNPQKHHG